MSATPSQLNKSAAGPSDNLTTFPNPAPDHDYTIRMSEYFDTFLKGAPAPEWIVKGIPRLQMEEHLKSRQKKDKVAS